MVARGGATRPPARPAFLDRDVSQFGWSAVSPSRPALSQRAARSGRQGKGAVARSHAQPLVHDRAGWTEPPDQSLDSWSERIDRFLAGSPSAAHRSHQIGCQKSSAGERQSGRARVQVGQAG